MSHLVVVAPTKAVFDRICKDEMRFLVALGVKNVRRFVHAPANHLFSATVGDVLFCEPGSRSYLESVVANDPSLTPADRAAYAKRAEAEKKKVRRTSKSKSSKKKSKKSKKTGAAAFIDDEAEEADSDEDDDGKGEENPEVEEVTTEKKSKAKEKDEYRGGTRDPPIGKATVVRPLYCAVSLASLYFCSLGFLTRSLASH